jgi:hypothetical protein
MKKPFSEKKRVLNYFPGDMNSYRVKKYKLVFQKSDGLLIAATINL